MAERIRAFDWATSPLGPVAGWPRALSIVLETVLAAQAEIILFWGPQHVALYNDAYAPKLGDRHPHALGRPARDSWQSLWPELAPMLERVRNGGASIGEKDHAFYAASAQRTIYFDISFSPVRDDDGSVGGVLCLVTDTTERVRAARRADDERQRLAAMFEQAPGFMAMLHAPDHVVAFANPAFERLIGASGIVGQPLARLLPADAMAVVTEVAASGISFTAHAMPTTLRTAEGGATVRKLDFVVQPIRDDAGKLTNIFIEGSDVTDRIEAERKLALSESSLHLAIATAEIGTWDVDPASLTLRWNEYTYAMFGIPVGTPMTFADFRNALHPDDVAATAAAFEAALDPVRRADYDVEYRTIGRTDGLVRWVAAKGRGVFEGGACVRAIGSAIDITRRKRAQDELRESELRFRSLADSAPALIWMCNADGDLIFANQWHERTFGRPVRDLFGGGWQDIIHPDDAAGFRRDFDAAFAARLPFGREVRVIDRDGATRWLHCEARARHSDDCFIGYVGCDVDVTESRLAAEALERRIAERTGQLAASNHQLSAQIEERERVEATLRQMQRLEAVGQLTSGVAHDFNNLLTVILGNIEMITAGNPDDRIRKRLGYMRLAAERGATLTAQLLAFSRRQRLEARPIDLNATVASMRDLIQSSMGGSVRLETKLAPSLWPALVDPTQIELIILNLAINARDAMEVGGTLTIETDNVTLGAPERAEEPPAGDHIMIAVADSGTGMTPEVREKAFEPFFTTKEVGKGSGLGLAQVYGFLKQSGGGVAIETAPGIGTTVRVYLPRAEERRLAPRNPATSLPPAAPTHQAEGRRILVVDDDARVRDITVSALRAMGAEVIEAGSGDAALDRLEETSGLVDLLVVDFAMPGMNGAELVAAARARWPALPSLYVTGYADLSAIATVSQDVIVQKPFRSEELARKVGTLLARATA
ncbi:PAS domain-containing hybrid sensor histidine kinase/response regulator [Sphingomonas nostoxanthinifaciens]|uniref:PAS domain-containing hybrid sensor histidine kinase/response regulator n=1 Tax=Sphingomonas nostoxanthinifaciens TaxID=2872652 RepID=UPI001CC1FDBC|nr:PAS domain S-box protein [Sphingomonas nostoxanthinifaciens]UAK24828.1 PAS domain S-box protein [Sphingomonas nostoxanthinifaciens]